MKNAKPIEEEIDYRDYTQQQRSSIFSLLCKIGAIAAVIQGLNDYLLGFPFVGLIDVFIGIVMLFGFFINKTGYNHFAKMFVFISSNVLLFLFATVVPQGVGIYLLFFPLVVFYFISFDFEHRRYSFSFTLLSLILNIILLISNYQLFGDINLQPTDPSTSFAINLILSIVLISLGINYLIKMNHLGEQLLWKQKEKSETLSKQLIDKNLALEKTNQELDRFVYSASHDLKAPLASIKGLLNLANMEEETIPSSISTYLLMMKERVNRLNIFIRDILDYSRNSRLDITADTVNVSQLVDEIIPTINYLENTDKVKIIANIEPSISVKTDKDRLFRVLINLVSNAIKYSDLNKEKSIVTISATINSSGLTVAVVDNGIGIEKESEEKIFDMFYRGTQVAEGSGLGLYISREMIHKVGGTLEAKSELGRGSTFTIQIPSP